MQQICRRNIKVIATNLQEESPAVLHFRVGVALQQQTADVKVAIRCSVMKWGPATEENVTIARANTVSNWQNDENESIESPFILRLNICFASQQQTADVQVAIASKTMQRSVSTEKNRGKHKNKQSFNHESDKQSRFSHAARTDSVSRWLMQ